MSQETFNVVVRGFDVKVEASEAPNTYVVQVTEGRGVPWTVEVPVNLDNFDGDNEDLDGSNELLNFVAEAAVDLFEASRDTLGEGAGVLEVEAMRKAQCCTALDMPGSWQDVLAQLRGTMFETRAVEVIKQLLEVEFNRSVYENPADDLRKELRKLEYDLELLELELLQGAPEPEATIIVLGHRKAFYTNDVTRYLDLFVGTPQEPRALSKIKELLDLRDRINEADSMEPWSEYSRQVDALNAQLQGLLIESIEQHAMPAPTGIESAPNMANDLAELMEGVDLRAPTTAQVLGADPASSEAQQNIQSFQAEYDRVRGIYDAVSGELDTDSFGKAESYLNSARKVFMEQNNEAYSIEDAYAYLDAVEDLIAPYRTASKQAFGEVDPAEDREEEGGHIRHDLDPGCIDPEDYEFEPNQKVKLKNSIEISIGGGVPMTYDKGTPGTVESRYDGAGDLYYVRFEDGQLARVRYNDLSKSGRIASYFEYMNDLLGV